MSPSASAPGFWTNIKYRTVPESKDFYTTPTPLTFDAPGFRDEREVFVRDIRAEQDRFTLEKEGLEYIKHPVDIKDWTNAEEVKEVLLRETPKLVQKRLGASRCHVFIERIRHSQVDPDVTAEKIPGTFFPHADFQFNGHEKLKENLQNVQPPVDPAFLPPNGRVVIVNVWRPLKTIKRDPLGFLVPSSEKPEDRHPQYFSYGSRSPDSMGTVSYNDQHEWVLLGEQQPDEPVMFVQWDSALLDDKFEPRTAVVHSALEDPRYVNETDRVSMEIKLLCFFENDPRAA